MKVSALPLKITKGFSLVELTVVMVIIGLLLGGLMMPLSAHREIKNINETEKILEEAREAILGFAISNARLPCPASENSNGEESFCTNASGACGAVSLSLPDHGRCSNPFDGFLPASALGLSGLDENGFLRDAWGTSANRIRYAVHSTKNPSNPASYPLTEKNGIKKATMTTLLNKKDFLSVCNTSNGIQSEGSFQAECASAKSTLTKNTVAVIFSTGKNAAESDKGADETANLNNDPVFVSHTPSSKDSLQGEFDDILVWISPYILFNRMFNAGLLP